MHEHIHGIVLPSGNEQDIYVVDGHFTFEKPNNAVTVVKKGYIVPGLVDAHAHLSLSSPAPDNASSYERVRESANAHLHAGVLVIREPGSPGYAALKLNVEDGFPRIQTAGRFLAPHGKYFPGLAREIDEEDLPAAAEEECHKSGSWAKVIGDFFDGKGNFVPNFSLSVLKKAAERVHSVGGRIATHVVSAKAIERAIEAGFDSIEHGTAMTQEYLQEMAKNYIAFTPTMTIREGIVELLKETGSPEEFHKTEKAVNNQAKMVKKAFDLGITVLAGTDAGMVDHGIVFEEIQNFFDAGATPEQALGAGSWDARSYLGYKGIEEGADADIVVFEKDPRKFPEVLKKPSFIMLDGHQMVRK